MTVYTQLLEELDSGGDEGRGKRASLRKPTLRSVFVFGFGQGTRIRMRSKNSGAGVGWDGPLDVR